MSQPNQKTAVNAATVNPSTQPKTFEEAVASLQKQPKMVNPYSNGEVGESTLTAKNRLRLAHRFETERGKLEASAQKAVGIGGAYGRVPSVRDALQKMFAKNPDGTFTVEGLASLAEVAYRAANVDRKVSKDGSQIYTAALLDFIRLLGFVSFDPATKAYRMSPVLKTALQPPTPIKG